MAAKKTPAIGALLKAWQPGAKPGKSFDLSRLDPGATPFSSGDKSTDKARVEQSGTELDGIQNLFYADRRFKLLVVLQGIDGSGKDGTLRGVFGNLSPLGVHTVGWRAPTAEESAHDFLWRIHQRVPSAGEFTIFNRSHYEDVLVPVVNGKLAGAEKKARFRQINDFERMLTETGTVVLKFMLHISKEEQRKRLQERVDDPTKNWKFEMGDLDVRKQWDAYQKAYGTLLAATSTPWAPWTVVPADSKTHRNLMIGIAVRRALDGLGLRLPATNPALKGLVVQ